MYWAAARGGDGDGAASIAQLHQTVVTCPRDTECDTSGHCIVSRVHATDTSPPVTATRTAAPPCPLYYFRFSTYTEWQSRTVIL